MPCPSTQFAARLLFVVVFLGRLHAAILRSLRLGLFHRLLGFCRLFGASFSTLLAFFVEDLLAAEKLEERLIGSVALVPGGTDDARVSAVTIAEPRTDRVEKLDHRIVGHEIRRRQAPRCKIATLAQSDHLLDQRTSGLRLWNRGLDTFLHDHRSDQVAQQRAPVRRVSSEFESCNFVTHFVPSGAKAPHLFEHLEWRGLKPRLSKLSRKPGA